MLNDTYIVRGLYMERCQGYQDEDAVDCCIRDEQHEELVVLLADAVQHPRAMAG